MTRDPTTKECVLDACVPAYMTRNENSCDCEVLPCPGTETRDATSNECVNVPCPKVF
jgi:hypothetical protein